MFWRDIPHPCSGPQSKPNNQQEPSFNPEDGGTTLLQNITELHQTTECRILDESTLYSHCCENSVSCVEYSMSIKQIHPIQVTVSYLIISELQNSLYDVLQASHFKLACSGPQVQTSAHLSVSGTELNNKAPRTFASNTVVKFSRSQ